MVSYLARYANRVVTANDRLIKIQDGEVYFSYKDYLDDNRRKVHHPLGVAFLSQFLQHILPRGLHKSFPIQDDDHFFIVCRYARAKRIAGRTGRAR